MAEANLAEDETIEVSPEADALAPVEITIDGDKTEVKEITAKEPRENEIVPAEAGIEDLKRQLAEDRKQRLAIERQLRESQAREADASQLAADANVGMVVSAIDAAKVASDQAKAEYKAALETGDYAKAADAQEKIADARANLLRLQERKAEIEARKTQPVNRPSDPVEQLASQLSPASAAWIRAHPEQASNFKRVAAAHNAAVDIEGLTPDTPEYFAKVEEILGMKKADTEPEIKVKPRAAPAAQAPVSNSTTSLRTGQQGRQIVTLSAVEREIAREMGMSDREYAIEKIAAMKAGQIGGSR